MIYMYTKVNGIQIHYEMFGDGKPVIIINPNKKKPFLMYFLANKLKNNFLIYKIDRRCTGKSQKNCTLSYEDSADDIYEFMKKFNIVKPTIIGVGAGGLVAMRFVIAHPTLAAKLIICSSYARNDSIKKFKNGYFEKLKTPVNDISEEELKKIKIPTMIFNGGKRDYVPFEEAEYLNDKISKSKMIIVEKSAHCSYLINNRDFYETLINFINE